MTFESNPAPEGSSCTVDTDPANLDPTPCGKPAIVVQSFGDDIDDRQFVCEDCRIHQNRMTQKHDQAEAFEEEHGYPPDRDLADLAWRLGGRLLRIEKMLGLNAPVVILRRAIESRKRTEKHIWRWLAAHEPEAPHSWLSALNLMLEDVKKNYLVEIGGADNKKTMLVGLKGARRVACALEIDRFIEWEQGE